MGGESSKETDVCTHTSDLEGGRGGGREGGRRGGREGGREEGREGLREGGSEGLCVIYARGVPELYTCSATRVQTTTLGIAHTRGYCNSYQTSYSLSTQTTGGH